MNLNEWFDKGINPDLYIDSMQKHKENLLHIYDNFILPDDEAFFAEMKDRNLRVIAITEDWCGDAMLNVPVLLKMAEASDMQVRMILRDENLELMDQYLTNGKSRSIPIFIFIDEAGNEVAKWGPRAETLQQFIDESRSKLPPKEAPDHEEKAKEMYMFMTKSFRDHNEFWMDVYSSIKKILVK